MLRLRDGQGTVWDELLPAEARVLSPELAAVDALLDDERFLAPFVERFACPIGRPTIPIETYLRLMYLLCRRRHKRYYADPRVMPTRAPKAAWEAVIAT